jgi:hypothetical protein
MKLKETNASLTHLHQSQKDLKIIDNKLIPLPPGLSNFHIKK